MISELVELARWAPNHHLTNPWRFRVLGPESRERLMELAEQQSPGSAVKLRRAPTLIAVSAVLPAAPRPRTARICSRPPSRPTSCCWARTRAAWPPTGAPSPCSMTPACASFSVSARSESPVGLLYLGTPVQEQRAPERAPVADILTFLP